MKSKLLLIILGLLVLSSACNKEIRPDQEELVGIWVTKDASLNGKIEFTTSVLYIYTSETSSTKYFYNILNNALYRYPYKMNDRENFSTHYLYFNSKKKDELVIWNIGFKDESGYATFVRE
jgi:hypothetical protein